MHLGSCRIRLSEGFFKHQHLQKRSAATARKAMLDLLVYPTAQGARNAIAKAPSELSAHQIPSLIVVIDFLVFRLKFVSFLEVATGLQTMSQKSAHEHCSTIHCISVYAIYIARLTVLCYSGYFPSFANSKTWKNSSPTFLWYYAGRTEKIGNIPPHTNTQTHTHKGWLCRKLRGN
jgi:hypothetical protein